MAENTLEETAGTVPLGEIPTPTESGWDPRLSETLYELLYGSDTRPGSLNAELAKLEQVHGDAVYSELIYLLSHLRFNAAEAHRHWRQILHHRETMQNQLTAGVDVKVALVSYFVEVNRQLQNPKIIELRLFEQTRASAYRDELTGLFNYRLFRELLAREIRRSERSNEPLSLVMLDVDDFKRYNDRHGHETGNDALATIARLVASSIRNSDVAARYGGEEFVLILPNTHKTDAYVVAERAREKIESDAAPESTLRAKLTASLGIATFPADASDGGELIRCADRAMYVAKERGKNQVQLYGQDRRSYRRLRVNLQGRFRGLSTELHPLSTLNVSEGGVLFVTDRKLEVGSILEVELKLPGALQVASCGRVVSVREDDDGMFEIGLRTIEIPRQSQILLSRFIREEAESAEA